MFRKSDEGFTLRYSGKKFSLDQSNRSETTKRGLTKVEEDFSNLGALTIRLNNSERQRVALLGGMCRENYIENPVEQPGNGGNESGFFAAPILAAPTTCTSIRLYEIAHFTMGKGKVLNEFAQPVKHHNTSNLRGEQHMWDILHAVVWNLGINIPYQLTNQGFLYVCHPGDLSEEKFNAITQELNEGQYEVIESESGVLIKTASNVELKTKKFQEIKISVDPTFSKTNQKNGLVISYDHTEKPLGWMIHRHVPKKISRDDVEDLARIINLGRGGFHALPKEHQELLTLGLLNNNGFTLFTQNRTFNAVFTISKCLEQEFNFDPSQLLKDGVTRSYSRMQQLAKESEIIEDFLTGIVITEMVQPLKQTLPMSTRPKLPIQYMDSFKVVSNTAKAVAYAYDLKNKDASTILKLTNPEADFSNDSDLIDVHINGELQNPSLTNPKHAAALLATAILVTEQIIVEQLLRDAVKNGMNHPHAIALKTIINDDSCYSNLVKMASQLPSNDFGPILGVQFAYCDPIIKILRTKLGHQTLIELTEKLYQTNSYTSVSLNSKVSLALNHLIKTGDILQALDNISAKNQQSRGINAGLLLVAQKMSEIKNHNTAIWCNYFTAAVTSIAIGGAAYVADQYIKNSMKC